MPYKDLKKAKENKRKNYDKVKNNPAYKEKRKIARRERYLNNKEKELEHNRNYAKTHRKEINEYLKQDFIHTIYYHLKRKCMNNNIQFNLTEEYLKEIYNEKCKCCGVIMIFRNGNKCHSPISLSLDKIIPAKEYTIGNVQFICWDCNSNKQEGSAEDHIKIAEYIEKFSKSS